MTDDGLMETHSSEHKKITANCKERCPCTDITFLSLKYRASLSFTLYSTLGL